MSKTQKQIVQNAPLRCMQITHCKRTVAFSEMKDCCAFPSVWLQLASLSLHERIVVFLVYIKYFSFLYYPSDFFYSNLCLAAQYIAEKIRLLPCTATGKKPSDLFGIRLFHCLWTNEWVSFEDFF